jgi:manganese/zinc/iron transport system permease protein
MDLLQQLFVDYTLRTVALGAATLGLVSGALGTYAVLRQQSLLGDAISHAALPGIALAFLLTNSKMPLVLMLGAAAAGWLATLLVMTITETTRVKYDSALGMVLAVFFGFGLVLLTFLQKRPDATQAGLETFLFGQAAALVQRDVVTMAVLGALAMVVVGLLWKEFKLLAFDVEFGRSLGFPMRWLDIGLTTLLVVAIVIGLQTVGVVLMSAMIIAPAAAARQWTDRLSLMVLLSAAFGALAGVSGALVSSTTANLPTGPMIVLCISVIVFISFFCAPNRGLLWRWYREWHNSRRLRLEAVLLDLYALSQQHDEPGHAHDQGVLDAMSGRLGSTLHSLEALADKGHVRRVEARQWALTEAGVARAEKLARERGRDAGTAAPPAQPQPQHQANGRP